MYVPITLKSNPLYLLNTWGERASEWKSPAEKQDKPPDLKSGTILLIPTPSNMWISSDPRTMQKGYRVGKWSLYYRKNSPHHVSPARK